jgi:hypothetical protein
MRSDVNVSSILPCFEKGARGRIDADAKLGAGDQLRRKNRFINRERKTHSFGKASENLGRRMRIGEDEGTEIRRSD